MRHHKWVTRHRQSRNAVWVAGWLLVLCGWWLSRLPFVAAGLLVLNVYAAGLMAADKRAARRGGPRVPEASLLLSALVGGGAGALLGMLAWRHKTRHALFMTGVPLICAVQIVLIWVCLLNQ
ncbi:MULTISPECIES: DUF1294 domain-containing protein [Bacillales]|jgi:uncharacterized membrane protein YsdA (DUF1294 family)|uniref:DUF1294 domain-containing protein n=1 Tax=Brevibacillus TaxID=55080 RepID=UPI001491F896|nr:MULTISPECIES: DUF1294 domain-containing protein [Bacillales]MBR8660124.1 DUF1294 domain-containing protein [Brevibacillus sp. NL20B1]MDT3414205.1 uncharacterized membrane protein YsdA (DUF1294 family) [Brevibacillus aydinogluensis]NNV03697.1 DUF1294 domain-containing protein [Brevibacillus sp. MCWH]UFJ59813.1 DUF1294 domain-containing protein [Anoxybacillus sediminis]